MEPELPQPTTGLLAVRAHRAELRDSIAALEQALAGPVPGRVAAWAERVHVALVELSADLRVHIELTEGVGGLHVEVLAAAPRMAGAVRRLVADHVEITPMVEDLLARTSGPLDGDEVMAARALGVTLLGRLVRHRQVGADLVYEAYATDIGGEN